MSLPKLHLFECLTPIKATIHRLLSGFFVFALLTGSLAIAEVITDGSLGPGKSLNGPHFDISHELGSIKGSNLFHSFSEFNLANGESATFSGPAAISNILSRVTGVNPSNIDGTLRSTIDGANLYFLNPNGVFFGPNAQIDVSGAFVVSTADAIRLQDGVLFDESAAVDTLTTAPPAAFGFSGNDAGSITFVGNEIVIGDGKSFAAVGGDITIDGAKIKAPGGQVNLLSAASAGEAVFVTENGDLDRSGINVLGNVSITGSSEVNVDDVGGGRIFIRGDQVVLEDSVLTARTSGDEAGQGVDIAIDGHLRFLELRK